MQANDSVLVTPGVTGATVATHLANGKEYQVVMQAGPDGHLLDSRDSFAVWYPPQTNAANREVAELFNADATAIVRVRGIWVIPTMTGITGVQIGFDINKISAVGSTGSTVVTPRKLDSNFTNLNANITARYGSTAGATLDHLFWSAYMFNDETNPTMMAGYVNQLPSFGRDIVEIVLRQNQGVQVKQSVTATVGLTGALIYFVVE